MNRDAASTGRRDRQQGCSDDAIQACLAMKVPLGMPIHVPADEAIGCIPATGADNDRKRHDAIADRSSMPSFLRTRT